MKIKKCNKCGEIKEIVNFYKHKSTKDGFDNTCKSCKDKNNKRIYQNKKTQRHKAWKIKNLKGEVWKDIKEFEELYQVSNLGRVKRLKRKTWNGKNFHYIEEKIIKPVCSKLGYLSVNLIKDKKIKHCAIQRLVMIAFTPNPNNYPQVNHKDENPQNNKVDNLEWCTAKYNCNYGTHNEKLSKSLINNKKNSKPVYQYDLSGKFIKRWDSTRDCERGGFLHTGVGACCRNEYKQYKGYKWSYNKFEGVD